jgi:hypothetical protein
MAPAFKSEDKDYKALVEDVIKTGKAEREAELLLIDTCISLQL